ncbi:MAG TPA: sulfatase [Bacteroidales bacterium]|nr:sulfatase [Bacteroidales bacterium]
MKRYPAGFLPVFTIAATAGLQYLSAEQPKNLPNIIFILTDNQGAWSLGCYGNTDILTPNIDRLASEGIRFTRALSSNPVSSPTRATFLTGLIPSQHGVHSYIDNKNMIGPEAYRMIDEFNSLGEILRDAGYVCGLSGKWHLGDHLNVQEGFSYWVTKPGGHTLEFYDQDVIEDGRLRKEPGYTTDLWTQKGIEFIRQNKENPFFLFLAYNGPYALGDLMLNPPRNRHAGYYKDMHFSCFPTDKMHPWQFHNKPFHNKQVAMERLAAETSGVDDGVGEIMSELKTLGLDDNTVIIYSADQGYIGGHNGMWGMGDHFRPIGAHELMMNIPLIFRHNYKIKAGITSDIFISNYDFLPTLLNYLGLGDKIPRKPELPGRDFSPLLSGQKLNWKNEVFYEMENTRVIRTDEWKYVARFPDGPFELYNMKLDPQERFNLYGQPGTESILADLVIRLNNFFNKYADPQYNIWKGGRSKARRLTN